MPIGLTPLQKHGRLAELAQTSRYFTKSNSVRIQKIREKLNGAGVEVEEPIQNLGNGRALFSKNGFSFDSPPGIRQFVVNTREVVDKICKTVAKMNFAGITHNHLHIGNIGITKGGKIIILELNLAKFRPPATNFVGNDWAELSTSLSRLYARCIRKFQNRTASRAELAGFREHIYAKLFFYTFEYAGEMKADWVKFEKAFSKHFPQYKKQFKLP